MNKRKFLAPLAVSVAALLCSAAVPAQTSTVPTSIPVAPTPGASVVVAASQLVLTRSAAGELRLADHESHLSHMSGS